MGAAPGFWESPEILGSVYVRGRAVSGAAGTAAAGARAAPGAAAPAGAAAPSGGAIAATAGSGAGSPVTGSAGPRVPLSPFSHSGLTTTQLAFMHTGWSRAVPAQC